MTTRRAREPSSVALGCLEIWGGNQAIRNAISVPGIDAWVASMPVGGDAAGGDIHYVSVCACERVSRFVLADVSGHGEAAGDLARKLRRLMRRYINTPDQTRIAQSLNRELASLPEYGLFATAVLTAYFPPTEHMIICNAGHPRPLMRHAGTGQWCVLDARTQEHEGRIGNLPLGVIESTEYVQFAVPLSQGDIVLLYTDALVEAGDGHGRMLGEDGLLGVVRALEIEPIGTLDRRVLEAVSRHRQGARSADDETIIVLHRNAGGPPKQTITRRMRAMARMLGLRL